MLRSGTRHFDKVSPTSDGLRARTSGLSTVMQRVRHRAPSLNLAADLVRLKPDVIVTTATYDALAAQRLPRPSLSLWRRRLTLLRTGLVESLARPGGQRHGADPKHRPGAGWKAAGAAQGDGSQALPCGRRSGIHRDATSTLNWKELQLPARRLRIQLHSLEVRGLNESRQSGSKMRPGRALTRLAIMPDPVFADESKTDRGPCGEEPPAVDTISLSEFVGRWRSCELWARPVPTCSGAPPLTWTRS